MRPTSNDERSPVKLVVVLVIIVGIVRMTTSISTQSFHCDFSHYYAGGVMYAAGVSAYTEPLERYCENNDLPYEPGIPFAAHPPLILWMFSNLAQLSMPVAYWVWLAVQLACVAGSIELSRRILRFAWSNEIWLILVAFFLNSIATQRLIYFSQVQLLIGVVAYGALLAHLKKKRGLACGLITFASAFKIFPVVLAPWFLFAGLKGMRDFMTRLVGMATVSAGCVLVPGVATWLDFATNGAKSLTGNAGQWTNYSIQNMIAMLGYAAAPLDNPAAFEDASQIVAICGSFGCIVFSYLLVFGKGLAERPAFCIVLSAAVVSGVIAWSHYMVLLFLPIAFLAQRAAQSRSALFHACAAAVGVMVLMPQLDEAIAVRAMSVPRVLLHFYPLIGIALGVCLLANLIVHEPIAFDANVKSKLGQRVSHLPWWARLRGRAN